MAVSNEKKSSESVFFRGLPFSLTAVLPEETKEAGPQVCQLIGAGPAGKLEANAFIDVDPRVLRLVLPVRVSAGTYKGSVKCGDGTRNAVFQVDPLVDLRLYPEQSRFAVVAGEEVEADYHILNNGNVSVEVPKVIAFGIFLEGGVERALRHAYTDTPENGERRLDMLANWLADSHGGLVRVKVKEGAGSLASGELRTIKMTLIVPKKLATERTYTGNLELPGLSHPIAFDVKKGRAGGPDQADDGASLI